MAARSPGTAPPPATRAAAVLARGLVVLSGLLAAILVLATPASAYWRAAGHGAGGGTTGTLAAPTGVTVPAFSLSSIAVTWTASTGSPSPSGYYVTRTTGGTTAAACATSASTLLTSPSCTDSSVADGTYTYKVVAVFQSWTAVGAAGGSVTVVTPAKVVFTGQPSSTVAGAAITPSVAVAVQTASGAAVPLAGRSVTLAIGTNPGGGTLSGTATAATDSSGTATFSALSINKAGVAYTLTAAGGSLTGATSSTFTITAATGNKFAITSTAVSGTASAAATLGPITVQEQDTFGNPVLAPTGGTAVTLGSNSAGTHLFALTSGGGAVASVTIPAGASSVVFYYGDTKAGTPTITAGGALTSATQVETISAGTAATLAFGQQPTNTAQGATITPAVTVQIQDQFGNLTTSTATVAVAISHNGGLLGLGGLSGTKSKSAVAGVATFSDLSIAGLLGVGAGPGYTLQVTSSSLTAATSTGFSIT